MVRKALWVHKRGAFTFHLPIISFPAAATFSPTHTTEHIFPAPAFILRTLLSFSLGNTEAVVLQQMVKDQVVMCCFLRLALSCMHQLGVSRVKIAVPPPSSV